MKSMGIEFNTHENARMMRTPKGARDRIQSEAGDQRPERSKNDDVDGLKSLFQHKSKRPERVGAFA